MLTFVKQTAVQIWRTVDAMAGGVDTSGVMLDHYNSRFAHLEARIARLESTAATNDADLASRVHRSD